ncbi:hypothetical protein [Asticcacaulis sp. AC402]|uniref:hypothetical protein n=1 Tax=Asticcacaulis sp. AC402 TaxID=1282361 RepID=UPI0003C3D449|nr:hypothetical protein [Asticcacaulis sp. AC402]ESQ77153.1 hypothetical protein ABAC402_01775 [Asticcacaulis sp. AC402]
MRVAKAFALTVALSGVVPFFLAHVTLGIPTAAAHTAQPVAATDLAKGRQIITNLKMFDLLMFGGRKGLIGTPEIAALPKTDQAGLIALFNAEMELRRAGVIDALVAANFERLSATQLDQLVQLSNIKYTQDLVLAGGDPSLATPNAAGMTAAERDLFYGLIGQIWVSKFFTTFDYSSAAPFFTSAGESALASYHAE